MSPRTCGVRLKSEGWEACGETATHFRVGPYGGHLPLCARHAIDAATIYPKSQIKPVPSPAAEPEKEEERDA